MMPIVAPVVDGSGAIVVHRALEAGLADYRVEPLSPYWGLMPPALALRRREAAAITHTLPELGPWVAHRESELIVTFHNYYLDAEALAAASPAQRIFYRRIMAPAVRASLRRAKWVTAVSRFTADLVQRHHALGERLVVVRNGVDTDLFSPMGERPGGPVKILFAGNPTRRKGAEHLAALTESLPDDVVMQVTAGLRQSETDRLRVLFRHSGAPGGRTRNLAPAEHGMGDGDFLRPDSGSPHYGVRNDEATDKWAVSDKLIAIARREHDEMPAVYRAADILFFPTRREGFGLVVAEAMACGLPVVATNCSSIPELVDHSKGGFLFAVDNRAEMRDYLLRLARDPVMRAEMGAYNRAKILAEFPLEKMLAGYRELFAA